MAGLVPRRHFVFRSHAPRAVVAALTAVVLIVGLMASTTSAAPKPKPTPTPTPSPSPTPTPTPIPNSDNRTIYFGDDLNYPDGNGDLDASIVTAGNRFEFTVLLKNEGNQRLTHSEFGYGSMAVDQPDAGASLPDGATIESVTLLSGAGSCTFDDVGALCNLGNFDSGETARIQVIVNAPVDPGPAFTYASFKVAENVPDQGANRNTFFANASFNIAATNSNANGTYLLGGAFSLSTNNGTLVKKDSMTTTVTGPDGAGAISISEVDCSTEPTLQPCTGQIATVHVREGAPQSPYVEWTLRITGTLPNPTTIYHQLDGATDWVAITESCDADTTTDCIFSVDKNGNETTVVFRTEANGRVRG
jgi:hypothetical protein